MDKERVKRMSERVFRDMSGGFAVGLAYLGTQTGLFRAMHGRGAMTQAAVSAASGLDARYVEEWLKAMVAAGYLDYDPAAVTYRLPDEHAYLLASEGTDHFMGGLFGMLPPLLAMAPRIVEAFRHGGGVPFAAFPPQCREAIDLMNRGNYEHRLVDYWLAQLPATVERLRAGGRVLDVGCGTGQVVKALAAAFPASEVVGVDPDAASIAQARAASADLARPPRFVADTLDHLDDARPFDLITACDCLHDLPDPLAVLADIRARLAPDGVLLAIEPRVADRLEDNVQPVQAMFYGMSVFHCMTQSLAQGGAGLGACLGPARTAELFRQAGFTRIEELPLRSPVNLFYAVRH